MGWHGWYLSARVVYLSRDIELEGKGEKISPGLRGKTEVELLKPGNGNVGKPSRFVLVSLLFPFCLSSQPLGP